MIDIDSLKNLNDKEVYKLRSKSYVVLLLQTTSFKIVMISNYYAVVLKHIHVSYKN